MASDYKLIKSFSSFRGLDLRSSDLIRPPEFASDITNLEYRKSGTMTKRKGYHAKEESTGGAGLGVYADVNNTTGKITEKVVTVDSNLHVLTEETLTITYSGADTAYVDIYLSSDGNFYLDLYDDNTRVLNKSLGTGIDEASPITVTSCKTDIDATANFSAVISGNGGQPAAFLQISRNVTVTSTGTAIPFKYWEQAALPTNAPAPFTNHQAEKTDGEWENASFANIANCLYIATGYDELYKYDGVRTYRAGLPTPATAPTTNLIAGSITDTGVKYIYTYEYTDAKGNLIESIASDESAAINPSSNNVEVTVSNIQDTTGFDTDSTDLKINLYRTTASGSTFFFVKSVVNDGTSATQVITDDVAIASLGFDYVLPIKSPGLPPKGKYLTVIQGLLIIAGNNENVDTVYYSDILNPEYFPPGDNSFNVDTQSGDKVTGLAPQGNTLFVFKNKSIHAVSGAIADDKFRVDLADNSTVGCIAHATIKEVNGNLVFLSERGVHQISSRSGSVEEISDRIDQFFNRFDTTFNFKQAVAINWREKDKYILFMPETEDNQTFADFANSDSRVLVWDYYRDAWLKWTNMNMMGGMAIADNKLYFTERRQSDLSGDTVFYLYQVQDTGDTWDYADHDSAIDFTFKSHWEAMGEPSVFKKFLRLKVHSLDATLQDFESSVFMMELETERDYIDNVHTETTLDFNSNTGGWGVDQWGIFPWGHTRLISVRTKLRSGKARSMRIVFKNSTLHENVLISGYEIEAATPYQLRIKE